MARVDIDVWRFEGFFGPFLICKVVSGETAVHNKQVWSQGLDMFRDRSCPLYISVIYGVRLRCREEVGSCLRPLSCCS